MISEKRVKQLIEDHYHTKYHEKSGISVCRAERIARRKALAVLGILFSLWLLIAIFDWAPSPEAVMELSIMAWFGFMVIFLIIGTLIILSLHELFKIDC